MIQLPCCYPFFIILLIVFLVSGLFQNPRRVLLPCSMRHCAKVWFLTFCIPFPFLCNLVLESTFVIRNHNVPWHKSTIRSALTIRPFSQDLIMSPNLSVANISMSPSNMSMSSTGIVVSPARTFGMSSLDQMTALDCDGIQTNQRLYRYWRCCTIHPTLQ